jgi:YidC/Oxa1 family membrane protein insertase
MDKKNFTIGVVLLVTAFAVLFLAPRSAPPPTAAPGSEKVPAATPGAPVAPAALPGATQSSPPPADAVNAAFAAVNRDAEDATLTVLRNDYIEARFTDSGGALREVALIKRNSSNRLIYPEKLGGNEPFVFNALHADPILAVVGYQELDRSARYRRISVSENQVEYRTVAGQLEVTRRYTLSPNRGENTDPYQIRHETTFRNLGEQPMQPMAVRFSLGTAAPINASDPGIQLTTGYSTGSDREFIPRSQLEYSNGFLGIGAHPARALTSPGPLVWTAVKNQFFASILTGDTPASALISRRVKLLATLPDETPSAYGVTGEAQFDLKSLGPREDATIGSALFVGPKEYRRLANPKAFKADQDKVMDFGMFRFFSQILLTLMTWIHGYVDNWGVAIILTTLTLKTLFVPLTLSASRSAKRMAKLQPEMQAIREKYKDNPQKQQQATMELFKSRKINPVGGCFPILVTIPFFIGFFQMLQSTAELRFAPFLWAPDLSSTDTVAVLFGILPLNIMPLLMGSTMVIQMRLTPAPSVDNMQMKMMKFMPYIFTLFCYSFSCALSLYSFVNGLFTIGQQLVINRMKDPTDTASPSGPAATTAATLGKAMKNVTPHKKLKKK